MKIKINKKRIASTLVALSFIYNSFPISEFVPGFNWMTKHILVSHAAGTTESVTLSSWEDLRTFASDFNSGTVYVQNPEVIIAISDQTSPQTTFESIGTESYPFKGTFIINNQTNTPLKLDKSLFGYIDTSARVYRGTSESDGLPVLIARTNENYTPLFANHVTCENSSVIANWNISANFYKEIENEVNPDPITVHRYPFGGFIGTIESNAKINLIASHNYPRIDDKDHLKIESSGDIGFICGKMEAGSKLDVTLTNRIIEINTETGETTTKDAGNFTVKSISGNAGGLVGVMEYTTTHDDTTVTGAPTLIFKGETKIESVTAAQNAGGLVGKAENASITVDSGLAFDKASISSGNGDGYGAGGIFGYYINSKSEESDYPINNYKNVTCKLIGKNCGSVFGILENNGDMVIRGTNNTAGDTASSAENATNYGGLIGLYKTNDLSKTLTITNVTAKSTAENTIANYGGMIGKIDNANPAYIYFDNVVSDTTNTSSSLYGGLIADTGTTGCFINVGSATINNVTAFTGGGLVGKFDKGVLRLSGITDLTNTVPLAAENCGQLVGQRRQTLIYAVGTGSSYTETSETDNLTGETVTTRSGWTFKRNTEEVEVDDIGTWGEVLRPTDSVSISDVLTENLTNEIVDEIPAHSVRISSAETSIGTKIDFIKTALNIQLNNGSDVGALHFADRAKKSSVLLTGTITLSDDIDDDTIDLAGTGITGFMRDDGNGADGKSASFTGTLNGNGNKISLAIGEGYGYNVASTYDGSACNGRIYRHKYSGLFSRTGTATINNLVISGNMYVSGRVANVYAGGFSAYHDNGKLTLNNITATEYQRTSANGNSNYGGVIGYIKAGTTVDLKGTTASPAEIRPSLVAASNDAVAGSIAGYIKGTLNLENVNISGSVKSNGASVGGITGQSGSDAAINIKNVEMQDLEIDVTEGGNGGLVGQTLEKTTITFGDRNNASVKGLTVGNVTDNKQTKLLLASKKDCGGLAQIASGYWCVESNGIDLENFTVSGNNNAQASVSSFGLLVNNGRINDSNCLYLELREINSYLIKPNVSLNISTNIFDEIMATSGKDVLQNGQPIISIRTTDGEPVKMNGTACNTYQNRTKKPDNSAWGVNPNVRYYYNLNLYRETPHNNKEKLLIWSVRQYAGTNLANYFAQTSFPSGSDTDNDFDMEGLSYYPVDVGRTTISGPCNFKFYNNEIEQGEGNSVTISAPSSETITNDECNRTTKLDGKSQHYLMHCGLFHDVSGVITVSGNVTFSGNVGMISESGGSGVLVCGTVNRDGANNRGGVTVSGSIGLNGIKVNGGGTADYAPLLINNVGTDTSLTIKNVSTGTGYSDDEKAATSLIGDVGSDSAANMSVAFNGIKLDSRTTGQTVLDEDTNNALYDAYHTKSSIFTKATLLNSFSHINDTSNGYYNFTRAEDWGANGTTHNHGVTYGVEISNSKQFDPSDQNKFVDQSHYSDADFYSSPTSGSLKLPNEKPDYSEGFLPYVGTYRAESNTSYELRVNQKSADIEDGCGTYNDPYIIRTENQLSAIDAMINGANVGDGLTLYLPEAALTTTDKNYWCDSKTVTSSVTTTEDPQGETTTTTTVSVSHSGHIKLKYKKSANIFEYGPENNKRSVKEDIVFAYMRHAYYVIAEDITINGSDAVPFSGLGGGDEQKGFTGVVMGANPDITITNNTGKAFVNNSNGCVIKDLTFKLGAGYSATGNGNKDHVFEYGEANACPAYGAVIAKIFGGDNIIDNVKVDYNGKKLFSGNNYLAAVGGYVGVIVTGGLYFRNMPNASANYPGYDAFNYIGTSRLYNNPYIGRVIYGFAVYEDENLTIDGIPNINNGDKNYKIANIGAVDKDCIKVMTTGTNSTCTLDTPQALFLLSAISQSGAGTSSNYGHDYYRTHMAQYDGVGKVGSTQKTIVENGESVNVTVYPDDFYKSVNDVVGNSKTPHIIDAYTDVPTLNRVSTSSNKITIELTGGTYDLSKTGFRGLNSLYNRSKNKNKSAEHTIDENSYTNYCITISGFDGKGSDVILGMKMNSYAKYASGVTYIDNYPLGTNEGNGETLNGFGFINYVQLNKNSTSTFKDVNICGEVELNEYDSSGNHQWGFHGDCVGGFIGNVNCNGGTLTISNVNIDGKLSVKGNKDAGGLVGLSDGNITFNNCASDGLTLEAAENFGGFVGECIKGTLTINGDVNNTSTKTEFKIDKITARYSGDGTGSKKVRAGGVAGYLTSELIINNVIISGSGDNYHIDDSEVPAGNKYIGGIVGRKAAGTGEPHRPLTVDGLELKDLKIRGYITGGVIGLNSSNKDITVKNSEISDLQFYHDVNVSEIYAGTIVGKDETGAKLIMDSVKIDGSKFHTNYNQNTYIGGIIGFVGNEIHITNASISNCEIEFDYGDQNTNKNRYFGSLVGNLNSKNCLGYNILVNGFSFPEGGGNANQRKIGSLVGGTNGTTKLVGVKTDNVGVKTDDGTGTSNQIIKANLVNQVFPNTTDSYAIFADYNGESYDENTPNTEASNITSGTNVGIKSPYITVNPRVNISSTGKMLLTGDGVSINRNSIFNDTAGLYSLVTDEKNSFKEAENSKENNGKFYTKLSTYKAEMMIDDTNRPDFPVLIVDTSSRTSVTEMIINYIEALTNSQLSVNQGQIVRADSKFSIDLRAYQYDQGTWESTTPTITQQNYGNGKIAFYAADLKDKDKIDTGNDRFNLIDVQFLNPINTNEVAYHLYIPVIVKRMLKYDFSATVLSGTQYELEKYIPVVQNDKRFIIDSLGTPITSLITFSYVRTTEEWQETINSGDDFLVALEKSVIISGMNALPQTSKYVLVDPQDNGKAYYSVGYNAYSESSHDNDTGSVKKMEFSLFYDDIGSDGEPSGNQLQFRLLNDQMLDLFNITAVRYSSDSPNKYLKLDKPVDGTIPEGATIKDSEDNYYRQPAEDETTGSFYCLSISEKDKKNTIIKESYYLSFFTTDDPDNNTVYQEFINSPLSLNVQNGKMCPNHINKPYAASFMLGNFYEQEITLTVDRRNLIDATQNEVHLNINTKISIKNEFVNDYNSFAQAPSVTIYHGYMVSLKSYVDSLRQHRIYHYQANEI